MSKTFSKKQLEEKAAKVFEQYPNATQVFATVDGNIFLMKNRAELHSKDKIQTFDRPVEAAPAKKDNDGSGTASDQAKKDTKLTKAEDIVAFIEKSEKLEDIKPYADDKRKTVKAAYGTKAEELAKNLEVKQ